MSVCKYKRGEYCGLRNDIRAKFIKIKSYCSQGYCPDEKPLTNADRIRQMTDEELAAIICCQNYKYDDNCFSTPCSECIMEWLKLEVQDETV